MNGIKLKPCPFCGGDAEYTLTMAGWEVACKECGAAMPRRTTEDDCLAAWSTNEEAKFLVWLKAMGD